MVGVELGREACRAIGANPSHEQAQRIAGYTLIAQMHALELDAVAGLGLSVNQRRAQIGLDVQQLSVQAVEFGLHTGELLALLLERALRQEYLLGLDVGLLLAEGHEVSALGELVYGNGEILVGPLLQEELRAAAEECHLQAGSLRQTSQCAHVEIAPRLKHMDILLHSIALMHELLLLVLYGLHPIKQDPGTGDVFGSRCLRLHLVGLGGGVEHAEGCHITRLQLHHLLQFGTGCPLLQLLHMHNAQLAQGIDECIVFPIGHQEGELLHLLNHAVASFLFSCKAFSIFCEDLERFSSSSMKRFILRTASW